MMKRQFFSSKCKLRKELNKNIMKIIELLMVEHASIRLHVRSIREGKLDLIYVLDDFVRNCHAKVEDEVVFPALKQMISASENRELLSTLSRLESDHKLIEKIGDQIKTTTASGDMETMKKRTMLYASTVELHNSSEEALIFPLWKDDGARGIEIVSRAKKIIEVFGSDRYFRITGISEKLYESVR
jgi:hemerythrin superfamily protein